MPWPETPHYSLFVPTDFCKSSLLECFGVSEWPGNLSQIPGLSFITVWCRKKHTGFKLETPGSCLASIAYYTASPTWLHIDLKEEFENNIHTGPYPRDCD